MSTGLSNAFIMSKVRYNAAMTLQDRIAAAADKLRKTGGNPRQVHLTRADAAQLQYERMADGGKVAHDIMLHGVQKAVRNIRGLRIVWGSRSFGVV
jgi:hypothetical protein